MLARKVSCATIATLTLVLYSALASASQVISAQPAAQPSARVAADSTTTNLLTNGDLESGAGTTPDNWKMWAVGSRTVAINGVTLTWDATSGYESKHSLCLSRIDNRYFPIAEWAQTLPLKDGVNRIQVSAYVRAKDVTKAVIDVQFLGANGQIVGHKWAAYIGPQKSGDPAFNHSWKRYSGIVDVPDGTMQITVAPQIYGPGTVWFDDITATSVAK